MATQNVIFQGHIVGQVPVSGDLQTDMDAADDLIKSLGIDLSLTKEQLMFRQATAFKGAAEKLYFAHLTKSGPDVIYAMPPFVVNIAFAMEVHLKLLGVLGGVQPTQVHKIHKLFLLVPDNLRQKAIQRWQSDVVATNNSTRALENVLKDMDNAFIEWRYGYEKAPTVRTIFMVDVINACTVLANTCRDSGNVEIQEVALPPGFPLAPQPGN